jgi:hypothetical protein
MTLAKLLDHAAAARAAFDASLDRLTARREEAADATLVPGGDTTAALDALIGDDIRRAFDDVSALRRGQPQHSKKVVAIDSHAEPSP